jgi:hypothetical protein
VSWDATLSEITEIKACTECGHELDKPRREESEIGWWNYTHNTAPMIYDALTAAGITLADDESWWKHLSGMSGTDGREYLAAIITQLEADPARYRPMSPPNGWGDYSGLLKVLREMRDAVPDDEATEWHVSG